MRFKLICVGVMALIGIGLAMAQATKTSDLHLRGDRFKPLVYAEMTPPQKTMIDHLLAGPRISLDGPFNVLLRSPEMGDLAQEFGAAMRFHSSLPSKLNEFAILLTARAWTAQFEWVAHHQTALKAGLEPAIIASVAEGRRPASMQPDEEAIYNFATELLGTKQVSDSTFAAVREKFGERGVVDLVGVIGYYQLVSALLNVDRYPVGPDARPELKPLK
jgi:4-carboxymuconolactone decarboxylase